MNKLMQHPRLQQFSAEWQKNPRLRIGVGLIAVIVLWVVQLELNDNYAAQQRTLAPLERQWHELKTLSASQQEQQQLQQQTQQLQAQQQRHWHAQTEGLAQANVRQALQRISAPDWTVRTIDLSSLQPTDHPDVWRMRGRYQGVWQRQLPVDILNALYQHQPELELREVRINRTRRNSSLDIQFELLVITRLSEVAP